MRRDVVDVVLVGQGVQAVGRPEPPGRERRDLGVALSAGVADGVDAGGLGQQRVVQDAMRTGCLEFAAAFPASNLFGQVSSRPWALWFTFCS